MRRLFFLLALFLAAGRSDADGHRTEAAATYSGLFGAGSTPSGWGTSIAIPFCWVTPYEDCHTNEWSFVFAHSGDLSATHEEAAHPDVDIQYWLAGTRFTWDRHKDAPVKKWDFVPFGHVLLGGVRRREAGSTDNFGTWLSGGAATATLGVEFVLYTQPAETSTGQHRKDPRFDVRVRAEGAGALYRLGDETHKGFGYAFALSLGWIID